ncbi:MAG: Bug family tripartite tricarboxylate transporter substrate binding protein [Burkholderiales bacterium]
MPKFIRFILTSFFLAMSWLTSLGWLASLGWLTSTSALAQTWPAKPIRMVVANSAGSATDVAGRVFADQLSKLISRPVAIENRPGGDGFIGAQAVITAPPDGYTLFFASQSTVAIDPNLHKTMPFDPVKDFTAISVVCDDTGPTAIFVHPTLPVETLQGLVDYAKKFPGKLNYGSTVPLFTMLADWIQARADIKMNEIRYKTTPQANQDALSGQLQVYITAYGPMVPNVNAGKLRVIAVTVRQPDITHIPTVAETFPGFEMRGGIFLLGPANLPADILQRINAAADTVVRDPQFNQTLKNLRWQNQGGGRSPAETVEFIRNQRERWARFIKEAGHTPK